MTTLTVVYSIITKTPCVAVCGELTPSIADGIIQNARLHHAVSRRNTRIGEASRVAVYFPELRCRHGFPSGPRLFRPEELRALIDNYFGVVRPEGS